jgi:hypothetical protein
MKRLGIGLLSVVALAFAAPAAADAPTEFPILDVFVHEHDSRVVVRGERTITTSDGFVGHGTDSFVDNGQVVVFRQADILTNASGDHFRARGLFVLDLSTDTVRIESFELTCLGP